MAIVKFKWDKFLSGLAKVSFLASLCYFSFCWAMKVPILAKKEKKTFFLDVWKPVLIEGQMCQLLQMYKYETRDPG